jgi:hypothetical protein
MNNSNGPVFESGPGWGARLNAWTRKNLWYVIPGAVIVLILIVVLASSESNTDVTASITPSASPTQSGISTTTIVLAGDNHTYVARRAIFAMLLTGAPASKGAQMYTETILTQRHQTEKLTVGTPYTHSSQEILTLFSEYEKLTAKQKASWEALAKKAGI